MVSASHFSFSSEYLSFSWYSNLLKIIIASTPATHAHTKKVKKNCQCSNACTTPQLIFVPSSLSDLSCFPFIQLDEYSSSGKIGRGMCFQCEFLFSYVVIGPMFHGQNVIHYALGGKDWSNVFVNTSTFSEKKLPEYS